MPVTNHATIRSLRTEWSGQSAA